MMIRKSRSLPVHHHGAVMVMVLLAMILLAALVFYVFNLGRTAQQRIVAQHAADATAIAGAGWVARSMNTIARNNVGIARSIALVNVMDSVPMAVRHTTTDQVALEKILSSQLSRGVSDWWVRDALTQVRDAVQREIILLNTVDAALNQSGFDIRTLTHYDGPNGRGKLWMAMESMDAVSEAAMIRLAESAQLAAIEGGQLNLRESQPSLAMLLPGVIDIPIERGEFDDFKFAVGYYYENETNHRRFRSGLTPQAVAMGDDNDRWYLYRGPFDAVFGWRWDNRGHHGGPPTNYRVYGPQEWAVGQLGNFRWESMQYSRFAFTSRSSRNDRSAGSTDYWINQLSGIRRSYLWPGENTQQVVHPKWENSFTRAVTIAETAPQTIQHTRFVVVEIKSLYPRTDSLFGTPGTWAHVNVMLSNVTSPRVYYYRNWKKWNFEQVDRYIWRNEYIKPDVDHDGNVISQMSYRIDEFMFAGIDIGVKKDVDSPHNFSSEDNLPAPIDFIHDLVPIDDISRQEFFTYLGLVEQDGRGGIWSYKFDGPTPRPRIALAQARVFNNHSWDLWTPMWHAQLEPITGYDYWLDVLDRDAPEAALFDAFSKVDFTDLHNKLTSLQPLVEMGMTH